MSKKRKQNKKKSDGIWFVERRGAEEDVVQPILLKSWEDVTSMDLYRLFEFNWKTSEISQRFDVKSTDVINKLRF